MRAQRLSIHAVLCAIAVPRAVYAQAVCAPPEVTIAWSQPKQVPVMSEDAERWPLNASVRLAYAGIWCPEEAQIELTDEDGETIPAQIRIQIPSMLVANTDQPVTLLDIDPIKSLEPHRDYRLVVRPPNPSLPVFEEYVLDFRTSGRGFQTISDFEGAQSVDLIDTRCNTESGPFQPTNVDVPECPIFTRVRLNVRFQPLDRADVTYIIYRKSTVLIDEEGNAVEDPENPDPGDIPVGLIPGRRDPLHRELPPIDAQIVVPYSPHPRRDCFTVRLLDDWGREIGDPTNEVCYDLMRFEPCPEGCDPMAEPMDPNACQFGFPPANEEEVAPPTPGRQCANVGLDGADPDRPTPPIGTPDSAMGFPFPDAGPDAGPSDASPDGGDTNAANDDGGSCRAALGTAVDVPGALLFLGFAGLGLAFRRRHA